MPLPRVQGYKVPLPPPPPVSIAVVKRSRRKGRGVFATAQGISARCLAAYYPAKLIRDPGSNSGHALTQYFVEVAQDDTLVAVPFSVPPYRPPFRGIPFNGWFVNEGECSLQLLLLAVLLERACCRRGLRSQRTLR